MSTLWSLNSQIKTLLVLLQISRLTLIDWFIGSLKIDGAIKKDICHIAILEKKKMIGLFYAMALDSFSIFEILVFFVNCQLSLLLTFPKYKRKHLVKLCSLYDCKVGKTLFKTYRKLHQLLESTKAVLFSGTIRVSVDNDLKSNYFFLSLTVIVNNSYTFQTHSQRFSPKILRACY